MTETQTTETLEETTPDGPAGTPDGATVTPDGTAGTPATHAQPPAGRPGALDPTALDLLFAGAHTTHAFVPDPVDPALVREAYEHLRWAPTAMNIQPLRLTVVTPAARPRLLPHMSEGNRAKTAAAPLAVVAAVDPAFHEHLPHLAPFRAGARDGLAGQPEQREQMARTNGLIQLGYLILALRGLGLAVGPMTGLDPAGVDAEFHAENGWRTLAVLNVGHAADPEAPAAVRPRGGRLEFDQAAQVC
ncbi:malonic semialdehyde reductase [Georgenia sp. TF02-10]|uniref:malonic semialdehyde reductase n=1 Tax=Georgenia sp. TF02-10 TaxID=2917725 RepID=UPI001FA7A6AD|nr:malonic semialdehyde reductase [Georgenia sp. TF02-10]UNX54313.1 malonic semialdehyde reductase [Georgenia sp. TF02-10]